MTKDLREMISYAEIENWNFTKVGKSYAIFEKQNFGEFTQQKVKHLENQSRLWNIEINIHYSPDKVVVELKDK